MQKTREIDFKIFTASDGTIKVRIIMAKSGWSGGLVGNHKVKNQYKKAVQAIIDAFSLKELNRE